MNYLLMANKATWYHYPLVQIYIIQATDMKAIIQFSI